MLKKDKNTNDVNFILENLRKEDLNEIKALWGRNYKQKVFESINNTDYLILIGVNDKTEKIPVAIGGFYEVYKDNPNIACVWLLSTKYIKYNKKEFFSALKKQLEYAETKYFVMYNFIYKENFEAKKWLRKFGFKFDNPKPDGIRVPENFEFFYKLTQ